MSKLFLIMTFRRYFNAYITVTISLIFTFQNVIAQIDTNNNNNNNTSNLTTSVIQAGDSISISLALSPYVSHLGTYYVPTNQPINATAILNNNSGLNVTRLAYKWSTKDGPISSATPLNASSILLTFKKPDENNFVKAEVKDLDTNATGTSQFDVIVKSPLVVADPTGKLFLERGELLDIKLRFTGSPPFTYCYKICTPYDILPCGLCLISYDTDSNVIPIVHYLHSVGNYTLLFQIGNIMNQDEKRYAIKINDTVRTSNLPIAPIVSTILAVLILISGVALHLKFRDTSYATETANFDFFNDNEEEWEQEFSFIQRVKYLFCGEESDEHLEEESRHLLRRNSPLTNGISSNGTY